MIPATSSHFWIPVSTNTWNKIQFFPVPKNYSYFLFLIPVHGIPCFQWEDQAYAQQYLISPCLADHVWTKQLDTTHLMAMKVLVTTWSETLKYDHNYRTFFMRTFLSPIKYTDLFTFPLEGVGLILKQTVFATMYCCTSLLELQAL